MSKIQKMDLLNDHVLDETLMAARLLLPVNNVNSYLPGLSVQPVRMGYPVTILLMCFIEGLGHRVMKGKDAFCILKHEEWYGFKLTKKQCQDIYGMYRCKLCHNMVLPAGFRIDYNPNDDNAFYFDINKKKVIAINLYILLTLSETLLPKFKLKRGELGLTHDISEILSISAAAKIDDTKHFSLACPSGNPTFED